MKIISEFVSQDRLDRAMPVGLKETITVKNFFDWFNMIYSADVWTEDGWLLTAAHSETRFQGRKQDFRVVTLELEPDDILLIQHSPQSRKWVAEVQEYNQHHPEN